MAKQSTNVRRAKASVAVSLNVALPVNEVRKPPPAGVGDFGLTATANFAQNNRLCRTHILSGRSRGHMLYESQSFRLESDDGVVTLWLEFRGRTSHSLTLASLNELSLVLDRIARLPTPDAVVLRSSAPGVFLDGFDPHELARFASPLEFAAWARRGQEVTRKLASLEAPTVALIEGRCIGAGLEIAAACCFRIAVDSPSVYLKAPDVSTGFAPAWGSTYRLPRTVGLRTALRMLLDGLALGPVAARRAGLIDRVFAPASASIELMSFIDRLREDPTRRSRGILGALWRTMTGPSVLRRSLRQVKAGDAADTRLDVLRAVAAGLASEGEGLTAERVAVTRLGESETARRRLELNARAAGAVRLVAQPANPTPPCPRRIGIVGGGDLGVALACRLAQFGHEVVVQERHPIKSNEVVRGVAGQVAEMLRRGRISAATARGIEQAIRPTSEWVGFENAELVIEAATEDPGIKRNIFQELESRVRPRVILATASSTVLVETIQAEMARPGRIAGLHLPNPHDPRPIAELVGAPLTDDGAIAALAQWSSRWNFTPVVVADRPGRLVQLVRQVYLSEGVALVSEGLPIDRIDAACRQFGFVRGPLQWCDAIGLDHVAELTAYLQMARDDGFARNLLFQRLLPYGCIGQSVGEGFYRYRPAPRPNNAVRMILWQDLDEDARAPYVFDPEEALRDGIERVVLRTINEAAAALVDEPDSDPSTVDLALALGMGWAPARGGPLRHADDIGLGGVVDRLSYFAERFGPRFAPCDELVRRAEAGEGFYGNVATDAAPAPAWRMAG
jgi:3-hydroxyacyl-CoA dehydrogenase/enoyl-CoA hydratase/3-hydroxybutyryl-CoA epimerase